VDDRRHAIALFRYSLVREAADPALSTRQRGALVRQLAERDHLGPDGQRVRVSRNTLDRWIRAWRAGGFEALLPADRSTAQLRTPLELLELAAGLKREAPMRTSAQITQVLRAAHPDQQVPSPATIRRYFHRIGLHLGHDERPRVFGRFEAAQPNLLWTGDALHGPTVDGRKTYLFAFIDDHSRALVGYRWGLGEDTLRLEAALRAGLAARGAPAALYVDNGSAFVSKQLERACAVLGIRLIHSRPGQPAGRGKIERVFRTVREQFLVELDARPTGCQDLAELNRLFQAWVEGVYHHREHSETGKPPLERFLAGLQGGAPTLPTPAELREAFLWSERRQVTKTAEVSLHGNRYRVDPALVGASVELVFDPFDLTQLEVRYQGRAMGTAAPAVIGRHVHPAAKPETPTPPRTPTGIDYLGLVEQRLAAEGRQRISYALLAGDRQPHDRAGQRGVQAELAGSGTTIDPHNNPTSGHADGDGAQTTPPGGHATAAQPTATQPTDTERTSR
jgi:putative transposase